MAEQTWRFDSGTEIQAGPVRRAMMRYLRGEAYARTDFEAAEVIFGELLANAINHAPGEVSVQLDCSSRYPIVRVKDQSGTFAIFPVINRHVLTERGRGLMIIRALARRLVVTPLPSGGTEISVELPTIEA